MADSEYPEEFTSALGDAFGDEPGTPEALAAPIPFRFPLLPWFPTVSGEYRWTPFSFTLGRSVPRALASESEATAELSPFGWWFQSEKLRLDVDGRYPQMVASGTLYSGLAVRVHWIANLTASGTNTWTGFIWYKDGNTTALPYTNVTITVIRSWFTNQRRATVTFSGGGAPNRVRTYRWSSAYFHPVELEFDTVTNTTAVTSINTCDHPNRPAGLPCENLSIETVFRRAGFQVTKSGGDGSVPLGGAGANARWSDMEMHDAMQTFWSRFANKAQWSMWVLFAALHEQGTSLGGIMFDDIGPNHRQGTAIFNNSFIKNAPSGDPDSTAWIRRMKFWTACHEMGHAFNLAHSWQKSLVFQGKGPWIPLPNEPEARSFMNYPFNVAGGQSAFFSDFEFRFSDGELLFMRHAPERFVQMGNADWFDDHGFEQAAVSPGSGYALELRVHRNLNYFEFLEPAKLELKLKNVSSEAKLVEGSILSASDHMTVILKKDGKPARQWAPYAQRCYDSSHTALAPGQSLYGSLYVAAGLNGWDLAEPGVYHIQVALHLGDEDVISNVLKVRVAPPQGYDEEFVAQDFFSEDVGRTLAFNGSLFLKNANDTLHEVADRLGQRRVAYHARMALGNPYTRDYKTLALPDGIRDLTSAQQDQGAFKVTQAKPTAARKELMAALIDKSTEAVDTIGHIDYNQQVAQFSDFLAQKGDPAAAGQCLQGLHKTLSARGVLGSVLNDIETRRQSYASKKSTKGKKTPSAKK